MGKIEDQLTRMERVRLEALNQAIAFNASVLREPDFARTLDLAKHIEQFLLAAKENQQ